MHPMLNIAVRAARKAGNLIAKHYETPDTVETSQKGSNDFVTNVDKAAEAIIIETIRKSYPQHTIITEESGEHAGDEQAPRGQGAPLNGYRLRGSNARDLDGTIIATGFPFKAKQHATTYMNILGNMFTECADFRRTGSAALDLAYVAAGRVDGYFEIALKPWDFAAGELIAREAGAIVCDFTGGHNYMLTGNIVAGNPRVVKAMLANMREQLSAALKR